MYEKIIGMIYPDICPVCGEIIKDNEKFIHPWCRESIVFVRDPRCGKCGAPIADNCKLFCEDCMKHEHYFDRGVAVFVYGGELKKSILRFKYKNERRFGKYYADEMAIVYRRLIDSWNPDAIIPIPIHKEKRRQRGFNQTEIIAKELAQSLNIFYDKTSLIRIKNTRKQKDLGILERRRNLESAFAVDEKVINKYNTVILIDDIYTTGATMDSCAKLLKAAGVEKVYYICVSIGVGR
ncbi:MAG: ComF family protein [Eubacterium sp.]